MAVTLEAGDQGGSTGTPVEFAVDSRPGLDIPDNNPDGISDSLHIDRDGRWTDIGFSDSLRVVQVAPYSEAYFQLLKSLPALAEYFALGESLAIAGDGVALELTVDGATTWSARELRAVLDGFEGSL